MCVERAAEIVNSSHRKESGGTRVARTLNHGTAARSGTIAPRTRSFGLRGCTQLCLMYRDGGGCSSGPVGLSPLTKREDTFEGIRMVTMCQYNFVSSVVGLAEWTL